jgi:hypothetical protein
MCIQNDIKTADASFSVTWIWIEAFIILVGLVPAGIYNYVQQDDDERNALYFTLTLIAFFLLGLVNVIYGIALIVRVEQHEWEKNPGIFRFYGISNLVIGMIFCLTPYFYSISCDKTSSSSSVKLRERSASIVEKIDVNPPAALQSPFLTFMKMMGVSSFRMSKPNIK